MVKYYHTCHRELWFYSNKLDVDRSNTGIVHGSKIDDTTYTDGRRRVFIDGTIAIDVLEDGTVVEIKRSSKLEQPGEWQLKFYLWYLKTNKGLDVDGQLSYPRERKRESVELTTEDEEYICKIIPEIQEIIERPAPPDPELKPICDTCAYHDFCWV
ncbi:CRISPR-associated protein Cas4 [Haloferax prahovense]|uniref:CRISPR-associated protein Cas4 n=1 Tax=Haloferax prahovense TaxID=381852 RepID=UPI00067926F7|nr:CRISPR-associated protein Cas4 [Haloferax prahovense]